MSRGMSVTTSSVKQRHLPGEGGFLQGLSHVHVSAVVVSDDEIEVGVSSNSEQLFHVSNQLLHPPSLIFH